jgi:hypothetical protein
MKKINKNKKYKSLTFFYLTVGFQFLNLSFHICLLFVPEMSASIPSYLLQILYISLAWILHPLQFSLRPSI